MIPPDEPLSTDKPLLAARHRLEGRKPKNTHTEKPADVKRGIVIGMQAAGVTQREVAEVTGLNRREVGQIVTDVTRFEGNLVQTYRDRLKAVKMERAHKVEGKLWDRLNKEIDHGEARDVDAVARAIHASEKVQASASGETLKVQVDGHVSTNPIVDVKALILQLLST